MLGSIIMNGLMIMVWHCQDYYNGFPDFQDFGNRKILTGIKKSCPELASLQDLINGGCNILVLPKNGLKMPRVFPLPPNLLWGGGTERPVAHTQQQLINPTEQPNWADTRVQKEAYLLNQIKGC